MMKTFFISYDLIRGKNEDKEKYNERRNELNDCLIDDYHAQRIQRSLWILKSNKYTCDLLFDELLHLSCFKKTRDRLVVIKEDGYIDYNNMGEF